MLVPTLPRLYTVEEVEADPFRLNARLGTYTNFVNLIDLAAIAAPSGMRGDGLPSSVTLIGPRGADGLLAGLAAEIHAASGATMGATGLAPPPPAPHPLHALGGRIELAVFGAHLSGLALNGELIERGAVFVRKVETTRDYRLYALANTTPAKPGLLRVAESGGAAIEAEIWSFDAANFGAFVAAIPAPLGIGTLRFADGSTAKGFVVEAQAAAGALDVSHFGGWRAYLASFSHAAT
jgi:allophanate hydrolase